MRTEKLNWVYACVEPSDRTRAVRLYGLLEFDEEAKLIQERTGPDYILLKGLSIEETDAIKGKVIEILQGNLEKTAGLKLEADYGKIVLMRKSEFEKVARKGGSMYYQDVDRHKYIKRPITIYFSPFRSASTGKVRSKHILVIDADGKVARDWSDPSGWIVGWTERPLTNPSADRMIKEFLAENGIPMSKRDRAYRLNPQGMKNKLVQFQVSEDIA